MSDDQLSDEERKTRDELRAAMLGREKIPESERVMVSRPDKFSGAIGINDDGRFTTHEDIARNRKVLKGSRLDLGTEISKMVAPNPHRG